VVNPPRERDVAIKFGIHIGPQNISIDDLRRLWTYADTHGWQRLAGIGR